MQETHGQRKIALVPRSNAAVSGSAVGQLICFLASFTFRVLPVVLLSKCDLSLDLLAVPSLGSYVVFSYLLLCRLNKRQFKHDNQSH